jgi:hypothetical protein
MNVNSNQTDADNKNKNLDWTLRILFIVLILVIVSMLYGCGMFDGIILSKYDGKTYIVKSADGKISGTIKTRVTACSETTQCVYADYKLILSDNIPPKTIDRHATDDLYLDPNYFYAVNIYNNNFDPDEYSYDSNLKPIDKTFPANSFVINFHKVLRRSSPNDFLKFNHMDIYDASDPAYVDKETGNIDSFAHFKNTDKIRSYDYAVTPQ